MFETKQDIIEKIKTTSATLQNDEIAVLDNSNEIIDQKYLGIYYEKQYDQNGDAWNLVKASKHFRRGKMSEKALSMLSKYDTSRNDLTTKSLLLAALHTTKGAALADLNELEDAIVEAQMALRHNPYSPYPYNLMGRIAYQSGNPQEGGSSP
jgi:tetratricopeptide (TPR) repeat protein